MKLRKESYGRSCASDERLEFHRVHQVVFPDGRRRNGWSVRVRVKPRRLEYLARTLDEATDRARKHWQPWFLRGVETLLPAAHRFLYREALEGGEVAAFQAMLDALEEAGEEVSRGELLRLARWNGVFVGNPPVTTDESRNARDLAAKVAPHIAREEARLAHEENFESRRGFVNYPPSMQILVCYDNNPFAGDLGLRPRMLEHAKQTLQGIGVECLAEAQYPEEGEDAGYTVALVFYPVTQANEDEVKGILDSAVRDAVVQLSWVKG